MAIADAKYLIGIDGGGTGCRAALVTCDGKMLGQASGGPANVTTDTDLAIANVRTALLAATRDAGLQKEDLASAVAHIGLAGVMTKAQADQVAKGLPLAHCTVTDDRTTSVVGALGSKDGVLIAVGTGSTIASARSGKLTPIGGWGSRLGDQASGSWLGRALLERVLLCVDGLEAQSDLTRATLAGFGNDPNAIVQFASTAAPFDYASYVPAILSAAQTGDPTGLALMQAGAAYLNRALETLHFGGADVLCLTGGLGPAYADYLDPAYRAAITPPLGTALDGALALARRALDAAS